jgi:heat-inducible transcriptional repressor
VPDARAQAVLAAIINEHLQTGEPVGSKTIAERFARGSGWSPATIRNVMGSLEDNGMVEQPHTSAGRVPTSKGYRFYVDYIISESPLARADVEAINALLSTPRGESGVAPNLLERTSQLLSSLSKNVGIVVSPSLADDRLEHIEFVKLADQRVLVVLVSAPNIIHNKIIRLNEDLSQDELERTARYLNAEFSGKSLVAIRSEIVELMRQEKVLYDKLMRNAIVLCSTSLDDDADSVGEVYVDGTSNILAQPDFADLQRMRDLFRTFEEKSRLVKILSECIERDRSLAGSVRVIIGTEHAVAAMQDCTLITAPYRIGPGDAMGTISVVGPMRLEYARLITVVNHLARMVEQMFSPVGAGH